MNEDFRRFCKGARLSCYSNEYLITLLVEAAERIEIDIGENGPVVSARLFADPAAIAMEMLTRHREAEKRDRRERRKAL